MTRKRTVFIPCQRHESWYAGETRYRRAEAMAEGGWGGEKPCECHMRPGTDFFNADFVAENDTYYPHRS